MPHLSHVVNKKKSISNPALNDMIAFHFRQIFYTSLSFFFHMFQYFYEAKPISRTKTIHPYDWGCIFPAHLNLKMFGIWPKLSLYSGLEQKN